ncbi:MAG: RNA ligase family protein [Clostridia bacterium]|nr:RNA ligase family protein [Clostridia bacterium]
MNFQLLKYPRTQHLRGSRLGEGDEDLSQVPFEEILGKHIVIEEKIDGANSAISFDADGNLLLQSRGHYLTGGYNERHYNLMKQWANHNKALFYSVLGARYIMFGEWMYAKHTLFYDALPDYFMEFDIYDREKGIFLDTESRRNITKQMKIIHSVPVLAQGVFKSKEAILRYLGDSHYITENHMDVLRKLSEKQGLDVERQVRETDPSLTMEGLYIKVESDGEVKQRVKFVRNSFYQCVNLSVGHWQQRPIIPNRLKKQGNDS